MRGAPAGRVDSRVMAELTRLSISLENSLLTSLDRLVSASGHTNSSAAANDPVTAREAQAPRTMISTRGLSSSSPP